MRNELRFFNVFPSVVKAGETTEITIEANREGITFSEEEYVLQIIPTEKRSSIENEDFVLGEWIFPKLHVKVQNGKVRFSFHFSYEQEYRLMFWYKDKLKYSFHVYALDEDLYKMIPYRGDLHMHSKYSDGIGNLCELTSAYREYGYDFICITDHRKYNPSVQAKEMWEKVNTGLTIFPGEEVHDKRGYIHIVNFNGSYSINELIARDEGKLKTILQEAVQKADVPEHIDPYEFVYRKWICDEIRKSGGKAIYPHPFWTPYAEYHVETHMSLYTLKSGIYDMYEILGGCSVNENQLQVGLYNELRIQGVDIPIVGSSDSHDFIKRDGSFFDCYSTIVFAKNKKSIIDAIMNKHSVAVQTVAGETPRIYGPFRLIKYATFLMENFYPVYRIYTKDIGALMRAYDKNKDCRKSLEDCNFMAQEYKRKFLGVWS